MRKLALVAVAGCKLVDVGGEPDPVAPARPFAACVAPEGGFVQDPYGVYEPLGPGLVAEVVEVGVGEPQDGCFGFPVGSAWGTDIAVDDAWWFRVADDAGLLWTVGVWLPDGPAVSPAVGDVVSVDYAFSGGGFGPIHASVEVRDAADALLVWIGQAGDLDHLALPDEVTLTTSTEVGTGSDSCGEWASYAMTAEVDGVTAELPHGEIVDVGGFELRHGGYDLQTTTGGCPDWFVARVAAAISAL